MSVARVARLPVRIAVVAAMTLTLAGSLQPPALSALVPPDWELLAVGPFSFRVSPYSVRPVAADEFPMDGATVVAPYGPRAPSGYALYRAGDGQLYDHPVAQAQYVVNMLRDYRLTPERQYLDAAIVNADRLLLRATKVGRAIFFPYPFDYPLHGRGLLRAPWYSGMAQGVALAGFVRLFERTGDLRWKAAADATFASFLVPQTGPGPWVTMVEGELLWFEEYPWEPADHTFNGHVFALYGLYDYWRLTQDPRAERLIRGGLATSEVAASLVRVPGGLSRYCISASCLERDVRNAHYQQVHVGQFKDLYRLTGHLAFAQLAEALAADVATLPAWSLDAWLPVGLLYKPIVRWGVLLVAITVAAVAAFRRAGRRPPAE